MRRRCRCGFEGPNRPLLASSGPHLLQERGHLLRVLRLLRQLARHVALLHVARLPQRRLRRRQLARQPRQLRPARRLRLLREERAAVDVKGYTVDVKGYAVDVKGYAMDVKGYMMWMLRAMLRISHTLAALAA